MAEQGNRKQEITVMERSKWVLIGPVYPYKGGISHYTGLMYRALSKTHDVVMISYKMQYPKLLFKKEQRVTIMIRSGLKGQDFSSIQPIRSIS